MPPLPVCNPNLPFVRSGWSGNTINNKNQYVNLDGPSERGFADVLKWQLARNPLKPLKANQQAGIPIHTDGQFLTDTADGFTWLGHASFYISMGGCRIITDPVLFDVSLLRRFTELPCEADGIRQLDYILLSHNHRDHCDKKSMRLLCGNNPGAIVITGMEIGGLLRSWGITNTIVEMGWYQAYRPNHKLCFSYLPARHWNRRNLTDLNTMLWGSFMLQHGGRKLYFGADSGPGRHFGEIGQLYPAIDFALLGIGAYKPEWFMQASHTGPADALEACRQLGAQTIVPMHYGTFDLSDEPVFYAEQELRRLEAAQNDFSVLYPGIGKKQYWPS